MTLKSECFVFRMNEIDRDRLRALAKQKQQSQASVLRYLIYDAARELGIEVANQSARDSVNK